MNRKKTAKCLAIFAAMLVLLIAVPAYAPNHPTPPFPKPPFGKAYPAQINATGELTLKSFGTGDVADVTIDTIFAAVVPDIIEPDEYPEAEFHGLATATEEHLRLEGLFIVEGINFWAAFPVDKPEGISKKMYSANGELVINITEITLPPERITQVMMKGNVTKFGDQDAFGFLEANAKIGTHNFTKVHTAFTLQPPPRNELKEHEEDDEDGEEKGPGNFSISFYIVVLANATKTEMDYDGSDFYVEGKWNVYNRTLTVTHIDGEEETTVINVKTLLEEVPGKFNVTLAPQTSLSIEKGRWKTRGNFTLDIPDLENKIKGDVIFYHAKFADPGDRDIPRSDFNQDHQVDILDITKVAKAFGRRIGMPDYDPDLDTNSDFFINIIDLSKPASEYGQEY